MKSFEIFWEDLNDNAKKRLVSEGFCTHDNINLAPLAILDQEHEHEDNNVD